MMVKIEYKRGTITQCYVEPFETGELHILNREELWRHASKLDTRYLLSLDTVVYLHYPENW